MIKALVRDTQMEYCNAISTPATPDVHLIMKEGGAADPQFKYRSEMGSILYLAVKTRNDIAVAASMLFSHVEAPSRLQ